MKHLSSFLKSTVLFLTSLLILLSLISYNPKDVALLSSPAPEFISNLIGVGGAYLAFFLRFIFGYAAYFFPFALFFLSLDKLDVVRFSGLGKSKVVNILAFLFFIIFLSAFIGLFPTVNSEIFRSGGIVGFFLAKFFNKYLGVWGSSITIFLLIAINAILFFGFFFVDILKGIKILFAKFINFFKNLKSQGEIFLKKERTRPKAASKSILQKKPSKIKPEIKVYTPKVDSYSKQEKVPAPFGANGLKPVAKSDLKPSGKEKTEELEEAGGKSFDPLTYKLPTPDLLKVPPFPDQKEVKEDIEANIKNLETTLLDFGVEAKVVSVQKGPVVTMYELQPQAGVKINKISALSDDIALAMKSSQVRIVAPIPGRGTVGIEIPNLKKHLVYLREVVEEKAFTKESSKLTLAIGKDVSGNPVVADLDDMPHLLIAGATGAGKTVCVNSLISSMLFKAKPDELKFIMIDPKMVELASFAAIPHLLHPIISDAKKASVALNWAAEEMGRRYQLLAGEGCRNITSYNKEKRVGGKMPYIIIVVDELADLMIVARENIETTIQRLAQLSRAVGIHLILATQRPSVDVITGVIKANFPARISFKVASKVDSRTVLDMMGADKLIGKGDLLFLKPGAVKLIRAQGALIDDDDIDSLTNFIREQGKPIYEKGIAESEKKREMSVESDELIDQAIKVVLQARQASASLLQRRMRVGYTRAARLLDLMEQEGVVGPFCGSKAREILVDSQAYMNEKGWV